MIVYVFMYKDFRIFMSSSVRRGYQVYKEVCAACHSLEYLCFRHLTNVSHTEEEVKAIAAEVPSMATDIVHFDMVMLSTV